MDKVSSPGSNIEQTSTSSEDRPADTASMDKAQHTPPAHKPHAVVIGSGFGGLAAAVRLGARGFRVTVLERLSEPGGRARVFRQDGFTFDAGPTIITAPFLLEELWQLAGRKLADDIELVPMDPFYRIRFDDGSHFDYNGDAQAMRDEVAKFSAADVLGYDRFVALTERIFRIGFEQLGHVSFGQFSDMLKILPDLLKLQGYRSVYGLVSKYIRDDKLRQVFSFHPLLVGGNPFTTTSIYTLISYLERHWGVHFVNGGTGRLVTGLEELIHSQGNQVRCSAEVSQIITRDGAATGVELANGEHIAADLVVSNADVGWTYGKLLSRSQRQRWSDGRLARTKFSMSLFVWYFGTAKRYEDVPHHMIMLGPRYRELLRDIFDHKVLADDFSLYLHRPTATDPSLAPAGCDAFYVLSPVPNLAAGIDWQTRAEPYRRAIEQYLSETVLPDLPAQVISSRFITPDYFHDELLSVQGAAFGPEPVLQQSAWFRPHNRSEDVRNLYIVGAGTHPGAGVPGVISSARVLDQVVPDAHTFTHVDV
ncbi:MAG: phytoene desaturase [Wenzhouxiangellaceae bacterium]